VGEHDVAGNHHRQQAADDTSVVVFEVDPQYVTAVLDDLRAGYLRYP
jgi:hypothetical protein